MQGRNKVINTLKRYALGKLAQFTVEYVQFSDQIKPVEERTGF